MVCFTFGWRSQHIYSHDRIYILRGVTLLSDWPYKQHSTNRVLLFNFFNFLVQSLGSCSIPTVVAANVDYSD